MQNQAEVVRLETQLTVPTRNRSHLSDLWFAISCTTSLASWGAEFGRILPCEETPRGSSGTLEVVVMSERQGWVVARGVDLTVHGINAIEEMVRLVVGRVNTGVSTSLAAESIPLATPPWSRIGVAVQAGGNAVWRRFSPSRPSQAVDAISGR